MVRVKRLELSHLAILEPKSSASTNSAKPAYIQFLKRLETLTSCDVETYIQGLKRLGSVYHF